MVPEQMRTAVLLRREFREFNRQTDDSWLESREDYDDVFAFLISEYLRRFAPDDISSFKQVSAVATLLQSIRRKIGREPRVLDFMGYGHVLRQHGQRGGSFALRDKRSDVERLDDEKNGRFFVEGDILDGSSWRSLSSKVNQYGTMDVIFVRPGGGIHRIPQDTIVSESLATRLFDTLTPSGGVVFVEGLPEQTSRHFDYLECQLVSSQAFGYHDFFGRRMAVKM